MTVQPQPEADDPRRRNLAALRWDAAWIDPALRRMAETAARQSGLTVEAWMERAIRKACDMPPAAHLARALPEPQAPRKAAPRLGPARRNNAPPNLAVEQPLVVHQVAPKPEPEPFFEPDEQLEREPSYAAQPLPDPPSRRVRAGRPPVERGRGRTASLAWAAGIAAVLAIGAVAVLRQPGLVSGGNMQIAGDDTARSDRPAADATAQPDEADNPPMQASASANDRAAPADIPPPTVAAPTASEDKAVPATVAAATAPADTPAPPAATVAAADDAPVAAAAKPVQTAALPTHATASGLSRNDTADDAAAPQTTASTPAVGAADDATLAAAPPAAALNPPESTQIAMAPSSAPAVASSPIAAKPDDGDAAGDAKLAASLAPKAKAGDPVAEYRLGILYALGKGVALDYAHAARLLRSAAEDGLPEAEYDYGVLFDKGLGVRRDPGEAAHWYGKAAQKGSAPAALNLGYAYAEGQGVSRDLPEAARWFKRAADAGLVNAQFNLAYMYEQGAGVTKSPVDAYAWYSVAAERGDQGAKEALQRVADTLSSRQETQAKARLKLIKKTVRAPR